MLSDVLTTLLSEISRDILKLGNKYSESPVPVNEVLAVTIPTLVPYWNAPKPRAVFIGTSVSAVEDLSSSSYLNPNCAL